MAKTDNDNNELTAISQAAFAKLAGKSAKTVTVWKQRGYLHFDDDGLVLVEKSIQSLQDRGLGDFQVVELPSEKGNGPSVTQVTDDDEDTASSRAAEVLLQVLEGQVEMELMTHVDAERFKENFLALNARLKYETAAGRLVEKDKIHKLFSDRWAAERDAWEVWPSLVCGSLAAKFGIDQIALRVALEEEVEKQLRARVAKAAGH